MTATMPAMAVRSSISCSSAGAPVEAFGIFLGDEAGRDIAVAEARVLHQRGEEIDIVADAVDHELVERLDLRVDRFARGSAPR